MASRWAPDHLVFTGHALRQMFARNISAETVRTVVDHGEAIGQYPDDQPHPSRLLFALVNDRPIHVVLAFDPDAHIGYVVTAYIPDPDLWQPDFKQRRNR